MSHSACHPVLASVLGQRLDSLDDVRRIGTEVRFRSYDQLQAAHTLSGIDIAMCDLLGRRFDVPVYQLLGFGNSYPKTPYASVLFGATPEDTYREARRWASRGYRAVKFGWMGFGSTTLANDVDQLVAAREGLGSDADLLVDAAMAWGSDATQATERAAALRQSRVRFLEEPFVPEAYGAYRELQAAVGPDIALAGGEGCHNVPMALAMMRHSDLDYVQIDAGRIGGITAAKEVADAAVEQGRFFVNHTFTSHIALSASMQSFAGYGENGLCEYPVASKPVSYELTTEHIEPDADGLVRAPEAPGLGFTPDPAVISKYAQQVEISVGGQLLYRTPEMPVMPTAGVSG